MRKLNELEKQTRLEQLAIARSQSMPADSFSQARWIARSLTAKLPALVLWNNRKAVQLQTLKLVQDADTFQRLRANYVSMTLIGAVLVGRIFGILRNLVFEQTFDTGQQFPAFVQAQFIGDLAFNLVTCCALALALLPILTRALSGRPARDPGWLIMKTNFSWVPFGWQGLKTILLMALAGLLLLSGVLLLVSPWLVGIIFSSKAAPEYAPLALSLLRLTLFQTLLTGGAALLGFGVGYHDYDLKPAIGAGLALGLSGLGLVMGMLYLLVLADTTRAVGYISGGLSLGACLQIGLYVPAILRNSLWYLQLPRWQRPALSLPNRSLLKRIGHASLLYLNMLFGRNLLLLLLLLVAEQVLQARNFTSAYILQLVLLPVGLGVILAEIMGFPLLADYITARGGFASLLVPLRPILFLTLPLACLVCILGGASLPWSGNIVFSGMRFVNQWLLPFLLAASGMQGAIEIFIRLFRASRGAMLPIGVEALLLPLRIGLGIFLVLLALQGLLWGLSVLLCFVAWTLTLEAGYLFWLIYQRSEQLDHRQALDFVGRVLLAAGAMSLGCLAVALPLNSFVRQLGAAGFMGAALQISLLALEIVACFYFYLRIAHKLYLPEVEWVLRFFKKSHQ
ncbi:MAG TPA: hypothetical protein VFN23_17325 [Ktedonobacteraceae bacterium]|nr:hypothetical protein [Ktedonobacteraceae bacterium]